PPGLRNSHLPSIGAARPAPIRVSRTIGVRPIRSRIRGDDSMCAFSPRSKVMSRCAALVARFSTFEDDLIPEPYRLASSIDETLRWALASAVLPADQIHEPDPRTAAAKTEIQPTKFSRGVPS